MPNVKLGALCWNQYTDWPGLLAAGRRAERLGYETLWTWDQLQSSCCTVDGARPGVEAPCCDHRPLTDR